MSFQMTGRRSLFSTRTVFSRGLGSLFDVRLHRFSPDDALDRRKLWEGFLQWANRLSRLGPDNVARHQFGPEHFELDSFLDMVHQEIVVDGNDVGRVSGESGGAVVLTTSVDSLDAVGDYWIDWSVELRIREGQCRFVGGIPFIGNKFFASAQDFKAVMGWFQNSSDTRTTAEHGSGPFAHTLSPGIDVNQENARHGRLGVFRKTDTLNKSTKYVPTQYGYYPTNTYFHLSGSGAATISRSTGNAGLLLFCQDSSEFSVESANMSLRKRVR